MNFATELLQELSELAMTAAKAAGEVINKHRQSDIQFHHKDRGTSAASQVVTEVDHKAQAVILNILEPSCEKYDLALLTEESPDSRQRMNKQAFWCVDPMDGTLAFINHTPGFSVSIALVSRDGTPLIGVVYDPMTNTLFHAIHKGGVLNNGKVLQVPKLDTTQPLILQTDFSFKNHPWLKQTLTGLQEISRELGLNGADIQYSVGAVLNACAVLQMPNTCYFKYSRIGNSGGSLWDYAATACLFNEAGAIASDIYGQPMDLNRADSTFMNHRGLLYATDPLLADFIIVLNKQLSAA
ncbi:MAG: Inositol-1-monophosphatase (EC [uncultured Thiotrichaceae bacterium]|uniref:Inositol-1-monophosphatase (EC) n=1 Tax=uncultured Thiotrichaceae bacterium TaxID=298394 RepID=A0A6S6TZW6_9GAMM|nr:MAG: Inositol-1-monophosphatase (EC [uncultured Thiotrichaceae bacterium]